MSASTLLGRVSQHGSRAARTAIVAGAIVAAYLSTARAEPQAPAPSTGLKVAVVEMRRAILDTEDGLRAQATLRKYFERRQAELNGRQEELNRRREDIERQSKVLSREALQRAMDEWQRQMAELQATFGDYNHELQKRQDEITAPIFGRVAGLLRKVAKRDGYDLVLEKQAVPFARGELDLTDSVIMMYNAGEEGDPEPAPAPRPAGGLAPPAGSGR